MKVFPFSRPTEPKFSVFPHQRCCCPLALHHHLSLQLFTNTTRTKCWLLPHLLRFQGSEVPGWWSSKLEPIPWLPVRSSLLAQLCHSGTTEQTGSTSAHGEDANCARQCQTMWQEFGGWLGSTGIRRDLRIFLPMAGAGFEGGGFPKGSGQSDTFLLQHPRSCLNTSI